MVKDKLNRGLTDLRISLIDKCNLRCSYCMPKEIFGPNYQFLKRNEWLHFDELDDIVEIFLALGVQKVRLTGGEPLLRPGLVKYIHRLKHHHKVNDISLTTNGLNLSKKIRELKEAGLSRITISLDALDPKISGEMNGMGIGSDKVLKSVDSVLELGMNLKINMVVKRGVNESEILPMARYFKKLGVTLRFIEYMDVGNHNGWKSDNVVSGDEILKVIKNEFDVEAIDLSSKNEVAKRYRYTNSHSEFGLITSVTKPFCGNCTRARISADGIIFTCLFARNGLDLKKIIRSKNYSKELLFTTISKHWGNRTDQYSIDRNLNKPRDNKIEMSYIGG